MYWPGTIVDLPEPARDGFTFEGWYTNPAFLGEPITSVVMDRDRSVYAKWDEIIIYDKVRLTISLFNDSDRIQQVVDNQPFYFVRVDDRGQAIAKTEFKVDGFTTGTRTYSFPEIEIQRGKYILQSDSGYSLGQQDANTYVQTRITIETSATQISRSYYNVVVYDPRDIYSVLYGNGMLVINELIEDREANKANYGGVMRQYAALTAENNYTPEWYPGWSYDPNAYALRIKKARFGSPIKPTTMERWFDGCRNVKEISTVGLDTSECESFRTTFDMCQELTTCDISNFDTSKAKDMASMFANCNKWLDLNVDHFNTSNVENMAGMFAGLAIEHFAPRIDTSSVTWAPSMFGYQHAMKTLDISTFDMRNCTEFAHYFTSCDLMEKIIVGPNFVVQPGAGSTSMFLNCYNIVGANGTTYDASKVDGSMAHIDVPGNPGYFSGE